MIIRLLKILLLSLILTACSAKPTPLPSTPTQPPTATPAQEVQTPSRLPSATMQPPTSTPRPTSTPTHPRPTSTHTPDAQATAGAQAYKLKATQIAGFSISCESNNVGDTTFSPNGTWAVVFCGRTLDQTLEIKNKTGKQWILHLKDYLSPGDLQEGQTPNPLDGMYPVHWTSNEEYLYFASYVAIDGGGGLCFYGFGVSGLYRINVNSGLVSAVLPARSVWDGYDFAFSPGGGKVAYSTFHNPAILELGTGQKIAIDAGDGIVGNLTWSPDGKKLAYATCQVSENGLSIAKSSVKIFDLETRKSQTVLEVERNLLSIGFEDENRMLKVSNEDIKTGASSLTFFDWSSGQFITPTPGP